MADYVLSARGTYDGSDFDRGIEQSSEKLERFQSSCSAVQVALGNLLSGAITRVGSAISASMDAAIGRVDTMNNFSKVMSNLGVSADAADKSIDALNEKLKGLPTTLDAGVASVQRLTAKNEDIEKSTDYFLAMNNAIIAGGTSAEMQAAAIEQLSQAYSKGKMDMQEWRLMQQAMPAQISQISKAMNMTADELGDGLRKGSVSMESFMQTLVKLNNEGVEGFASFEEQARTSTGGIATQITNMHTAVTRAVANIIDKFNEAGAINDTIKLITDGVNALGNAIAPVAAKVGEKVSEMVEAVRDAFGPQDLSAIAETLGGIVMAVTDFVKAISPLLPTIAKVAPVVLAAHVALNTLAGSVTSLATMALPALTMAAEAGSVAAGGLASSLAGAAAAAGPVAAAITAAVAVIGVLVVTFADMQRKQEEYTKATDGLVESSKLLGTASEEAATGIEKVGSAASASQAYIESYKTTVDELVSKQAELADSMERAFNEVNIDNEVIQKYADTIAELAGNCGGSEEKLAELKSALKSYNDLAGTSYKVTDEFSGSLDVSTKELLENAEAYKKHADAVAAHEKLEQVQERLAENQAKLAQLEKESASAMSAFGDTVGMNIELQQEAADAASTNNYEIERMRKLIEDDETAIKNLTNTIRAGGPDALKDLGDSAEKAADSNDRLADSAADAAKALQEELDAAYKAQKRAYDHEYTALQNALSDEEKELSRSHSRQYDELKKSLDKRYDAKKKSLDEEYDNLKKALDKELDELRKADDKTLSQLKKTQDAKVKEFEKGTNERIALIDKEYKASLRLLEAEEKQRTGAIDDQIDALNKQSDAEARAIKEAQREEKKAELQKAVDNSRYASERAANEKALNDYIAEIEHERADEARKDQIEQLKNQKQDIKDEFDIRKQSLEDEKEARKTSVKETREAELEQIKIANEAEYEEMSTSLEAKETKMRESHDRRLEELKTHNESQLEELKSSNEDKLEEVKRNQQDQEDELKRSHDAQLTNMKEAHEDALEELKKSNAEQLEEFKKGRQDKDEEGKGAAQDSDKNARNAAENIRTALEVASDPIGYAAKKIREKVGDNLSPVSDDMEGFGESGGGKFAEAIEGKESDATNAAKTIANAASGALGTVASGTGVPGADFIQGFLNGMLGVDVWQVAWNIGNSALGAIKNALGIASPSKEAAKLGKFFSQGMADGIDDEAVNVVRSATEMAKGAYDAVRRMPTPTIGTLGYAGNVMAVPNGNVGSERGSSSASMLRNGPSIYIDKMTVRNRSDADYFAEVLCDKWSREGAGAL